ncbi:uncharacterized protein MONOS_6824 [Monocercomonoides exilis]|uniref:uncharacterized protein n=1 Tax=Monocercomonoides exilis TaxID=2049356 RepID=UPI0035598355|nr:hypothetical protein MONOS_6824 [Monocercomonoides exilis]|eukprot:MONOS_6824.1-p1 / transcript=MONOS_6824.1 / gene=MONOS_6824 / organism=Monocercomonoides_exilis_PA203 / gene_product=unspecified product / transcript_product=unspecified product / location=Mono_scaffold00222:57904-63682(-) / protein_length=1802 / sequence_SO=supercontig / SO=protein_coding / is_pseudo=false
MAIRFTTIQKFDTMLSLDFPLKATPCISEGKKVFSSSSALGLKSPKGCHRLELAGYVFYIPHFFVPQFHLRQKIPSSRSPFFGALFRQDSPPSYIESVVTSFRSSPPFFLKEQTLGKAILNSSSLASLSLPFNVAECAAFLAPEGEGLEVWVMPPVATNYATSALQLRSFAEQKCSEIGQALFNPESGKESKDSASSEDLLDESDEEDELSSNERQKEKQKLSELEAKSRRLAISSSRLGAAALVYTHDLRKKLNPTNDPASCLLWQCQLRSAIPGRDIRFVVMRRMFLPPFGLSTQDIVFISYGKIGFKYQIPAMIKGGVLNEKKEDIVAPMPLVTEKEKKEGNNSGGGEGERNVSSTGRGGEGEEENEDDEFPDRGNSSSSGSSSSMSSGASIRPSASPSPFPPLMTPSLLKYSYNPSTTPSALSQHLFISAETVANSCHPLHSTNIYDTNCTRAVIECLSLHPSAAAWHQKMFRTTPSINWKAKYFVQSLNQALKNTLSYSRQVIGSTQVFSLNNAIPISIPRGFGKMTEGEDKEEKTGLLHSVFSLFSFLDPSSSSSKKEAVEELPMDDSFQDLTVSSAVSGIVSGIGSVLTSGINKISSAVVAVSDMRSQEEQLLAKTGDPFVVVDSISKTVGGTEGKQYLESGWVTGMMPPKNRKRYEKHVPLKTVLWTMKSDGADAGLRKAFFVDLSSSERKEVWMERVSRYLLHSIESTPESIGLFDLICVAVTEELALTDPDDLQIRLMRQNKTPGNAYLQAQQGRSLSSEAEEAAAQIPGAMFISSTTTAAEADKASALTALSSPSGGFNKKVSTRITAAIILPPDVTMPRLRRPPKPKTKEQIEKEKLEKERKEKERKEKEKKEAEEFEKKEMEQEASNKQQVTVLPSIRFASGVKQADSGANSSASNKPASKLSLVPVDLPFEILQGFKKDEQLKASDLAARLLAFFLHVRIPGSPYRSKKGLRDVVRMLMSPKYTDAEVNEFICNEDVLVALLKSGCFQQFTSPLVAEECVRSQMEMTKEKEKQKTQLERSLKALNASPVSPNAQIRAAQDAERKELTKQIQQLTKELNDKQSPIVPQAPCEVSSDYIHFLCMLLRRALFVVNFTEDDFDLLLKEGAAGNTAEDEEEEEMNDILDTYSVNEHETPKSSAQSPASPAKSPNTPGTPTQPSSVLPSPFSSPSPSASPSSSPSSSPKSASSSTSMSPPPAPPPPSTQSLHNPSFVRAVVRSPREFNKRLVGSIADIVARLALTPNNRTKLYAGGILSLLKLFFSGEGIYLAVPQEEEEGEGEEKNSNNPPTQSFEEFVASTTAKENEQQANNQSGSGSVSSNPTLQFESLSANTQKTTGPTGKPLPPEPPKPTAPLPPPAMPHVAIKQRKKRPSYLTEPAFVPFITLNELDDPTLLSLLRCLVNICSSNKDAKQLLCTRRFVASVVSICIGRNELITSLAFQILRLCADGNDTLGRRLVLLSGGVCVAVSSLRWHIVPGVAQPVTVVVAAAQLLWAVAALKDAKKEAQALGAWRRLAVILKDERINVENGEKVLGALNALVGDDDDDEEEEEEDECVNGGEREKRVDPEEQMRKQKEERRKRRSLLKRKEMMESECTFCSFGDPSANDIEFIVDSVVSYLVRIISSLAPKPSSPVQKQLVSSPFGQPAQKPQSNQLSFPVDPPTTSSYSPLNVSVPVKPALTVDSALVAAAMGDVRILKQITMGLACLLKLASSCDERALRKLMRKGTEIDTVPTLAWMVNGRLQSEQLLPPLGVIVDAMIKVKGGRSAQIAKSCLSVFSLKEHLPQTVKT